jgi:hypothetical protein
MPWLAHLSYFDANDKPAHLSRDQWRKDYNQRNAEKPK